MMTKALLHELGKSKSFGRLSLLAKVLWPMLLSTSDDQGRGDAESDAIKWYVCPNVPEIELDNIGNLLEEMKSQEMITLYTARCGCCAYQINHWWDFQELQWARPSKWTPPDGWTDRIRYSNRGDYHQNAGWDTTGGYDAQPIERAKTKSGKGKGEKHPDNQVETQVETQVENSVDFQPNLTELNPTQPNLTHSDQGAPVPQVSEPAGILDLGGIPPPPTRPILLPDQIPKPDPDLGALYSSEILPQIAASMTRATYDQWLAHSVLLGVVDHCAVVQVASDYAVDWCRERLHKAILPPLSGVLRLARQVEIDKVAFVPQPGGT
jgi:hypothetical protein